MGAEGIQNALGYSVGTLAALESLRSPGGLGRFLTGEMAARSNPDIRAGLVDSPFSSGFLFTGGGKRALDLGPGGTGPSAPQQVWQPNLAPLAPEEALKQEQSGLELQLYQQMTPEMRQQALRTKAGVPLTIAEQMGQLPPNATPWGAEIGPQGAKVKFSLLGPEGMQAPKGYVRDPMTGRLVRDPYAAPGADALSLSRELNPNVVAAIAAGVVQSPKMTQQEAQAILDKQAQQAGAKAGETTRARELVKLSSLTSTTKTMIETAPSVLSLVNKVRANLQKAATGPAAGRWQELYQTDLGASDPDFAALNTNLGLLQTALQRMHTGARGGDHMLAHFARLVGEGKQAPENLFASLDEIEGYANDKISERDTAMRALQPGGNPSGPAPAGGDDRTKKLDAILFPEGR